MNRITSLFNIPYPIIQGGMIWCSGYELAAAVSNAGGLGLIGSGSMTPDILRTHIRQCKAATNKPFGVNIPLLFHAADSFMDIVVEEGVNIVFTSAGNPAKWTTFLKDRGIIVVHVVSNTRFAIKAEQAGVDAIVAEGFEAGGHNGKEETTTMVLIPLVKNAVKIPIIAAGGIATGRAMLAAMALGADGVQIGSRFAAAQESSAHPKFKELICAATEGDTQLCMKKLVGVRLLKNKFYHEVENLEASGATTEQLSALLGRGRARLGMFDGDAEEGELEIGQVAALINKVLPAADIINQINSEYNQALKDICSAAPNPPNHEY